MSMPPLQLVTEAFRTATAEAFPQLSHDELLRSLDVSSSTQPQFGHYQYNGAMKLSRAIGQPPRTIASALVAHLPRDGFLDVEIAGPGFVNITLDNNYLSSQLTEHLRDPRLGIAKAACPKRIIIDFSSPNTAKEMHVGHLRSTIIGDSLARLFEFLGHNVLRINHIGDWGTSFGMLIAYLKRHAPDVLSGKSSADLSALVAWYRAAKQLFDADVAFKTEAQRAVVALQSGDPSARHSWEIICDISRRAYQEIYDLLDVRITERGESYYNDMLPAIVTDLESKGLVTLSDGAKCIFLEGFQSRDGTPLPLMIQKSDGAYNYDTTDMAALHQRIHQEKGERLIYVVDAGQATHLQMIFQAGARAGYFDPHHVIVEHVPFGLVLGEDGKKFRTRSGATERLIDLLNEAVSHAAQLLIDKNPSMDEREIAATSAILGIGAVKYADLACHRTSNYLFSYERMLRFDGNTATFLMYAYVRTVGIKRRIGVDVEALIPTTPITVKHPSEVSLALHLLRFGETLDSVASDLLPNRLCDYLYALAEKFHCFFRDCRVEGSAEQSSRLLLCEAVARTMQLGLHLLGIKTVEKM